MVTTLPVSHGGRIEQSGLGAGNRRLPGRQQAGKELAKSTAGTAGKEHRADTHNELDEDTHAAVQAAQAHEAAVGGVDDRGDLRQHRGATIAPQRCCRINQTTTPRMQGQWGASATCKRDPLLTRHTATRPVMGPATAVLFHCDRLSSVARPTSTAWETTSTLLAAKAN